MATTEYRFRLQFRRPTALTRPRCADSPPSPKQLCCCGGYADNIAAQLLPRVAVRETRADRMEQRSRTTIARTINAVLCASPWKRTVILRGLSNGFELRSVPGNNCASTMVVCLMTAISVPSSARFMVFVLWVTSAQSMLRCVYFQLTCGILFAHNVIRIIHFLARCVSMPPE